MPSLAELEARFSAAVMARHIETAYFGALGMRRQRAKRDVPHSER